MALEKSLEDKSVYTEKRTATELCADYRNDLNYSAWARTKRNLDQSGLKLPKSCCYSVMCVSNCVIARHTSKEYTVLKDFLCFSDRAS
jgi:hypothetical protein